MRLLTLVLFLILSSAAARAECDGRLFESEHILNSPVCLPPEPRRVVILDHTYSLGMSLELGLPVVGAPLFGMSDEELRRKAEDRAVNSTGHFAEPSIERIIGLAPDLIVGSGAFGQAIYEMASRIAPTVLITAEDWKEYYRTLAAATGRSERMREAFEAYDARVAEIGTRVPDTPVSVLRITSWDFQVYLDGPNAYGPFSILRELGVERTAYETTTDDTVLKRPDWEELGRLNGEILLYIIGGANSSDTDGRQEEVFGNPLWQMLPAAKAGRVHRVDAATWMEFSGLSSAHRVLDDVERFIIGAP